MKSQVKISRRRLLALLGTTGGAVTVGAADLGRIAARRRVEGAADTAESDSPGDGFVRAPSLDTRLTRDYGVQYPFVSAGMGFVAYPPLVTAVSNAGGIGMSSFLRICAAASMRSSMTKSGRSREASNSRPI